MSLTTTDLASILAKLAKHSHKDGFALSTETIVDEQAVVVFILFRQDWYSSFEEYWYMVNC